MEKAVTGTVPRSSLSIRGAQVVWSSRLCPLAVDPALLCVFNHKMLLFTEDRRIFSPQNIPNQLNSVPTWAGQSPPTSGAP